MLLVFAIACGGALGAVLRYFLSGVVTHNFGMPWGILTVNILGCFLMGLFIGVTALFWSPSPEIRSFVAVGFLGALTTFSSFSLDLVTLIKKEAIIGAIVYAGGAVMASLGALYLGLWVVRLFKAPL